MAYFDELLQRAITVRNNRAPASNTADLVGGVLVGIVTALQMLLDDKQDELTFDTAPTADSQNPVTSDGIYQALQAIDLSACEKIVNKVTSINAQSTNVQYPTAKLLYDSLQALSGIYAAIQHTHAIADIINLQTELDARQLVSNLVTAITAQSTDQQYPSAKLLYDQLALKANQATTYTKTEIDNLIAAISTLSFQVVASLPVSDIRTDVIYLVPAAQPGQSNIYNEYIYVNNSWELIGSTAIDLSGYEQMVNKVTALTAQSTNVQYPSAKCVYDELQNLYDLIYYYHAPTYYVRGTSSNVNGTDSFYLQYKDDITGASAWVTETVNVDAEGNWEFSYRRKKIVRLQNFVTSNSRAHITSVDFSDADPFDELQYFGGTNNGAFLACANLVSVNLSAQHFVKCVDISFAFYNCTSLTTIIFSNGVTFGEVVNAFRFCQGCAALTSINISSATFEKVTDIGLLFYGCAALTALDLHSATFAAATRTLQMFYNCTSLASIDISSATFERVTDTSGMFANAVALSSINWAQNLTLPSLTKIGDTNNGMFMNCKALTALTALSMVTFANVTNPSFAFYNCTALTTLDLHSATFASAATLFRTFQWCSSLTSLSLGSAIFGSVTNATVAFNGCTALTTLDLHSATFAALTNANQMFDSCSHLVTLNMSAATFAVVTTTSSFLARCSALTTLSLPQGTMPTTFTTTASPLSYTSILAVANWCKDLTGQTAQSVTFKTSAWNALTAAEQSNIDTILSGKNWTRVLG